MQMQTHYFSKRKLWGSEIASEPPTVAYDEVMNTASESGMAKLTDHIVRQEFYPLSAQD